MPQETVTPVTEGESAGYGGRLAVVGALLAVIAPAPAGVAEATPAHAGSAEVRTYTQPARPSLAEVVARRQAVKTESATREGRALIAQNVPTTPHVVFGIADDGVLTSGDPYQSSNMLKNMDEAGTRQIRVMVHPADAFNHDLARFKVGIEAAKARGMGVNITASLEGKDWTDKKVRKYAYILSKHFGDKAPLEEQADSLSFGNEAGFGEKDEIWLRRMKGLDTAQTYRRIYLVGYHTLKQTSPNLLVRFGDLSGISDPIGFMYRVTYCPPGETCDPLPIEQVGYHPYQQTTPPTRPSPHNQAGVGSLKRFEYELALELQEGKIATPNAEQPKIAITEFSYAAKRKRADNTNFTNSELAAKGVSSKLFPRYLKEPTRARWLEQSMSIFCKDPNIVLVTHYGYRQPEEASDTSWNTPLRDATDQPLESYFSYRNFVKYHPECAITDPQQAQATMEAPAPEELVTSAEAATRSRDAASTIK